MTSELLQRLEQLALKRTDAFCYSCYHIVKTSHCPTCGSDDFARNLNGVAVDFGTEWALEHILSEALKSVNLEECFEEMIREVYSEEISVGWMKFDSCRIMKEMDPVSWKMAMQEWIDQEEQDANIISIDRASSAI